MLAAEKVNVGFMFAADRARRAFTRVATVENGTSGKNAMGKFDGKVKTG